MIIPEEDLKDNYSIEILNNRYNTYRKSYLEVENFKKLGINIRHQNPPEDITENIVKFIIRKYDNEPNIIWSKGIINKNIKYLEIYIQIILIQKLNHLLLMNQCNLVLQKILMFFIV